MNRYSPINNAHNGQIDANPFRSIRELDIDEKVFSMVKIKTEAPSPSRSLDGGDSVKRKYEDESDIESRSEETGSKRLKSDHNEDLGNTGKN